ncbi:MAG: hypothetical protein QF704_10285, partial [Anaerolineales bacterium]|nr:hypothetical protein [Anaerolineales bacterium]
MTDKKRNIVYLLEYSILLMSCFSVLRGDVIALGGYVDTVTDPSHGNHAVDVDDRDPVHGYINAYTSIQITVILTEGNTAQRMTPFITYLGFATEGSTPVTDFTNNMWTDADHAGGTPVNGQYALELFDHDGDGADDYRKVYTVTRDQIKQDASFNSSLVQYVDFQVEFNGARIDVDWTQGTTKTYLKYDDTAPWPRIHYWKDQSWVQTDNVTFTTQRLRIDPYSVLSNHGGSLENIIYINAAGTTNDKDYEIGGVDITQLNGDLDTIALPNNTFVNGIEYDITFTIYDSAGNERYQTGDSYISNITYDDVPPEIVIGYGGPSYSDIVKKANGVSFKHDTTKTSG